MVVTQVNTFGKSHLTVCLKWLHFIICKLYNISKLIFKGENIYYVSIRWYLSAKEKNKAENGNREFGVSCSFRLGQQRKAPLKTWLLSWRLMELREQSTQISGGRAPWAAGTASAKPLWQEQVQHGPCTARRTGYHRTISSNSRGWGREVGRRGSGERVWESAIWGLLVSVKYLTFVLMRWKAIWRFWVETWSNLGCNRIALATILEIDQSGVRAGAGRPARRQLQ